MKTKRQCVWLTTIAVAGSVALYGCGGGSSPDTTPYDQAAVDQAAQDAAAAAQAAVEARAVAIATAEAAQAEAEQAEMDAATAASDAANAATMAADNAMAGSIDVAAATSASMDAETASTAAETASLAAEAASARAAAVAHDDPAVAAAKTAAAAAAMAARMSADNAAASAEAAAASVTVAMQLQTQQMAGDEKAATDADNARLASEHAANADIYAGRAGEADEAARVIASEVMDGLRTDYQAALSAVRAEAAMAADWAGKSSDAKDLADGISAEGNEEVANSQTAAKMSAMNAATSADRATGAMIAVQGYADSNAIGADRDAVLAASAHVETLRHRVSWIVSTDADDVSSAEMNRDAAADLAPRLAENALADGGHNSQVTMARVTEMSGLASSNTAVRARADRALSEANIDYDSAVPLFEDGKMNKPGAEVESADDLATGGIVRTGENGLNTNAFTVYDTTLQSAKTISSRNELDYIGAQRIVSQGIPVYDSNDVRIGSRAEVIEYDRWAEGKPYEYITFGIWAAATNPDPSSGIDQTIINLPNPATDAPGSLLALDSGLEGGSFVFADRNMLWKRSAGGGITAQYNGSQATMLKQSDLAGTRFGNQGAVYNGPAQITVNFNTNTVDGIFRRAIIIPGGLSIVDFFNVSGMTLDDASVISTDDGTILTVHDSLRDRVFGTSPSFSVSDISGGIFGPDAEEIVGTILITGRSSTDTYTITTVFGGRHQSHQ